MKLTRRDFLKASAAASAQLAMMAVPSWLRQAAAESPGGKGSVVVMLLRGAADGLNMVVPYADPHYRKARPTIGLNAPGKTDGVLDLDGRFGLHPAMKALLPFFKDGSLAFVHAAGSPHPTRSHFDAQDFMESGTPGVKRTDDGWLNRALLNAPQKAMGPLGAVALTPSLPRILRGEFPVANMDSLAGHRFMQGAQAGEAFAGMYGQGVDGLLGRAAAMADDSVKALKSVAAASSKALSLHGYNSSGLHKNFADMAALLKAGLGTRAGFMDFGGWDHHIQEGGAYGQLGNMAGDLSRAMAAFFSDLKSKAADTTLVVMTEFGRTVQENGNRGTDHGHGGLMMVMGAGVNGGKVYGDWPGLDPDSLWEGQDLQVTTDFRQVCGEALRARLQVKKQKDVFPGFKAKGTLGIL